MSFVNKITMKIELRNLCSTDIPELKTLCAEWFPVELVNILYIFT